MNFFLQENTYDSRRELNRTGRPVFMTKIDLTQDHPGIDLNRWNDFTIDLSKLVKLEKGIIYRIQLRFKKSYSTLNCADEGVDTEAPDMKKWDNPDYYYSEYEYPEGYSWDQADNPCDISYYNGSRFVSQHHQHLPRLARQKRCGQQLYRLCHELVLGLPGFRLPGDSLQFPKSKNRFRLDR